MANNLRICRKLHLLFFLLFLFLHRAALATETSQDISYGGIRADSVEAVALQNSLLTQPPLSHTGLSFATLNKFGFDVIDDTTIKESWLIKELTAFTANAKLPFLDVGGGYGGLTRLLLEQGASVIYNDLEQKHLLFGRNRISPEHYSRLYLNSQAFPKEMHFLNGSFDAVIFHRVFHFMEGLQIEEGLQKAFQWLAPKGKIFIVILAPQHPGFSEKFLEIYEESWNKGNPWPGYGFRTMEALPAQAYNLPEILHVMDERPLELAFKKAGFVVEKKGFISMQRFGSTEKGAGQEAFGIIGRKD